MPFNLTPKRLRALRLIQQRPGLRASALIQVCDKERTGDGGAWSGFDRSRTGKQGATRWGAAYAKPLIAAGLVEARTITDHSGRRVHVGWAALYLTDLGQDVARTGKIPGTAPAG